MDTKENINPNKYQRYELMFINATWIILAIGISYFLLKEFVFKIPIEKEAGYYYISPVMKIAMYIVLILIHLLKHVLFEKGILENPSTYIISRILGYIVVTAAIIFLNPGTWFYVVILLSVMLTSLTRGIKYGIPIVAASLVIQLLMTYIAGLTHIGDLGTISRNISESYMVLFFLHVMLGFSSYLCGRIFMDNIKNDNENKYLVEQLKENYSQLEVAQEEIKYQYDKLKVNNKKLEEMNKKLSDSIAELYTLQQISQAISSILDISELLKYLNDIIIGVMGVSYSTIVLIDERTHRLKINTSNIANLNEMAILTDNINNSNLGDAISEGKNIMENYVDPVKYPFTKNRDINSFICIPLSTKSRKFGLVLIEHKYTNAFDDDNIRLLDIISQQVGIAMENAELYHKMHELAIRDGLTGVFNRQYFQERLETEVENAISEKYPLSLAIFDIDHFKRFNDTFGHLFGDKVLKSMVEAVSSSLRKNDMLARFGGEEFIILFPRTNLNEAYEKVEYLRKMIAGHVITDKLVTATITVSFGVSSLKECALTENELLRTADDALYDAKMAGRNCVKVAKKLD